MNLAHLIEAEDWDNPSEDFGEPVPDTSLINNKGKPH